MTNRTVLITGCSDGGLGSSLALELHSAGYRVFATARNEKKLTNVKAVGIETLILDVLSDESIKNSVEQVRKLTGGSLDVLVNNAGANYASSLMDASLSESRELFDLNVWSYVATTQAFLPLLLKSSHGGLIVNHTSVASVTPAPFASVYAASKAAMAMLTTSLRAELSPFGIKVVELKTGATQSNINIHTGTKPSVPKTSIYYPARKWLDPLLSGEAFEGVSIPSEVWAKKVAAALSQRNPPHAIWVGAFAWTVWLASWLPNSVPEAIARSTFKIGRIEKSIQEYGRDKAIADVYGK